MLRFAEGIGERYEEIEYRDGEKVLKICLFVLTEFTNVTDRRTHTHTHTAWRLKLRQNRLNVRPSVRCQHIQNPKAPRPLGRRRWNLARVFYGSGDKTSKKQNFEFRLLSCAGPPRTARCLFETQCCSVVCFRTLNYDDLKILRTYIYVNDVQNLHFYQLTLLAIHQDRPLWFTLWFTLCSLTGRYPTSKA